MKTYDLLDAVGEVRPEYVQTAEGNGKKKRWIVWRRLVPAAAVLFVVIMGTAVTRSGALNLSFGPGDGLNPFSKGNLTDNPDKEKLPPDSEEDNPGISSEGEQRRRADGEESGPEKDQNIDQDGGEHQIADGKESRPKDNQDIDPEGDEQGNADREENGKRNPYAQEEMSAGGDYPPMIRLDGVVFTDTYEIYQGKIEEEEIQKSLSYTDGQPKEDGEQNFDRGNVEYIRIDDRIICKVDGEWRIFRAAVSNSGSPSGNHSMSQSGSNSGSQTGNHSVSRSGSNSGRQSGNHSVSRSGSNSGSQTGNHSWSQTGENFGNPMRDGNGNRIGDENGNPVGTDSGKGSEDGHTDAPVDEETYSEARTYSQEILALQERISKAMGDGELSFVTSSMILENPDRIVVTVNTEDPDALRLLEKYRSEGVILEIGYSQDTGTREEMGTRKEIDAR